MLLAYKKLTKIAKKYCLILIDEDLLAIKNDLKEVAKAQKITIQINQDNDKSQTIEQKPYNKTNNFHNINYDDMINILIKKTQGKTNKEIADAICVNEKTIRNNLKKALEKTSKKERVLIGGKVVKVRVYRYSFKRWFFHSHQIGIKRKFVGISLSQKYFAFFIDSWWLKFSINLRKTKEKISAQQLVYLFKKEHPNKPCPSVATIYNWRSANRNHFSAFFFRKLSLNLYKKPKNKPYHTRKTRNYHDGSLPIDKLPDWAKTKHPQGCFQMDTVRSKMRDQFWFVTLFNLETKQLFMVKSLKTANAVKQALNYLIRKFNLKIKILIIDNGNENAELHQIKSIGQIYRCRPYCSSDKAQIENCHRLIWYWIRKGLSIDHLSKKAVFEIQEKINNFPRASLIPNSLISANEYAKKINHL